MNDDDDDLLDALGEAARAERDGEPDAVWDDLAHGRIEADHPELRAAAADETEHRALVAAFSPLSEERQRAIAAAVTSELTGTEPRATGSSRVFRITAVGAAILAVAAAALLVLLPGDRAPVVPFDLTVVGGVQEVRGRATDRDTPRFQASSRVEIRLRPQTRIESPVDARTFVEDERGAVHPWSVDLERAEGGAMRVVGDADDLFDLPPGTYTLVVVVGARDALATTATSASEQLSELSAEPAARVVRARVILEDDTR